MNPPGVRRHRTLRDLGSLLRPLLLPLLGIAVIGSFAFHPVVWILTLLAAGALAAWGLVLVGVPTNRAALWDAVRTAPGLLLGTVLTVLTVAILISPRDGLVNAYELATVTLIWVGFVLWVLVFFLRLTAFAVTPRRQILAVVLGAAYVRFFLGLFVRGPFDLDWVDPVVWLALVAIVFWWVARAEASGREGPTPDRRGRPHRWGLSAAVVSTVAFVLAGVTSTVDPHVTSESPVEVREVKDHPALQRPDLHELIKRPRELARRFSPVLQFTDDQRWQPIPVQSYLDNADLHEVELSGDRKTLGRPLAPRPLSPSHLGRKCPRAQKACQVLTVRCPLERAEETKCDHADDLAPGYKARGTAYTRVVYDMRKAPRGASKLTPKQRGKVFEAVGPYGGHPKVIVQYWLFYYYDDWNAQTLFGRIRQSHEADWEVVTLVFDDERPLFVSLSSHCGNTWVPWERARVAKLDEPGAGPYHPVVGVAEGSQANYYALSQNVPPNWTRCSQLGPGLVETFSFGYRVRDRTGSDTVLRPVHLEPASDDDDVMRFRGYWGWNAAMYAESAFGRRLQIEKTHPDVMTPPLQPLWYQTIRQVFCSKASDRAGGGPKLPKYSCRPTSGPP